MPQIWNLLSLLISFLTLLVLYCTYLIDKKNDSNLPTISTNLKQIKDSHIGFHVKNYSKVEVEISTKIKTKINESILDLDGFYGSKSSLILPPFIEENGHFDLKDLRDKKGKVFTKFVEYEGLAAIRFIFYLKYRKIGDTKWKEQSPQIWIYHIKDNKIWRDVNKLKN